MTRINDGKIMAKMFFEDYDGKDLSRSMSDFVNSFSFDKKGFLEYIEESEDKNKILNVLLLWLIKLEYLKDKKFFDLRNEYSVNIGTEIANLLHDKVVYVSDYCNYEGVISEENLKPIDKEVVFVEEMGKTHRTLQQSFSGIVFEALLLFPEIKDELISLEYNFHKVPLI